jgi:3-methylcrotonyl-CoA carboxylase alpha subunit
VLIKAVAGGGGKGMRRVDAAAEFADALLSCKREAASSFGDDRVLIEKYIMRPRHIEVQVFGDRHGNVVHLFERDCSLQRRHQKVIEEAPAPGMDEATREAVCGAAVRAAQAVNYVGAGTIEFIADASEGLKAGRIWFMEMNTRLQVEHPVTEEVTGVDLVEWQLRVASGEKLPLTQEELSINGWAMEARLYAEDPATGFLPSTGPLKYFRLPAPTRNMRDRVDTGVREGGEISPFYDPMIAKLIVHRETRDAACKALALDCSAVSCWPVRTNAQFLVNALQDPDFVAGDVDTGLIVRKADALTPTGQPSEVALQSVAHMVVDRVKGGRPTTIRETYLSRQDGPWTQLDGMRLNADPALTQLRLTDGRHVFDVVFDEISMSGSRWVERTDDGYLVNDLGASFMLSEARAEGVTGAAAGDGAIISPMPGKIIALEVSAGDAVTRGQKLLTLEAMKMEHSLVAPFDGKVAELNAEAGAQVSEGALLVRIEKGEG